MMAARQWCQPRERGLSDYLDISLKYQQDLYRSPSSETVSEITSISETRPNYFKKLCASEKDHFKYC